MKKLLLLFLAYLLLEGNNVIGDGLYVYHRGSHAVEQLKTKVDEYYPKVKQVDKEMSGSLENIYSETENSEANDTIYQTERPVIQR